MEENLKQLLLKDLCARLPYGLIVEATYKDGEGWKTEDRKLLGIYEDNQVYVDAVYTNIENAKPYLRPMSSMTEEEREEYRKFSYYGAVGIRNEDFTDTIAVPSFEKIDYLNSHHFDYRGLIEKGLALEAPKDMYNTKTE